MVEQLGNAGFAAVEDDTNMRNYEKMEQFYADYQNGQNSMVTIYDVHRDGVIGAVTFVYREEKLQTYYIGIQWKEEGIPEIEGTSVSDVAEIKLTEKGYFIYAYENVIAHASLRQYWRIKPLSEECRELTRKYLSGLSYVNYNVLVTNWDSSNNVEDILMPCMFEDIYRIATGEILKAENGQIPAEEYEKIMTTYFPVSVEQIREHCGYDANSNSYPYEMIYARPYPPFGEVVDYRYHNDGTITLIVDGVWADYNSDFAFQNVIVVQPFEDEPLRVSVPILLKKRNWNFRKAHEWKDDEMKFRRRYEVLIMVLIFGVCCAPVRKENQNQEKLLQRIPKEQKMGNKEQESSGRKDMICP